MRSLTFALATLAMLTVQLASGAPAPWGDAETKSSEMVETGNAYTGTAGLADGGSAGDTPGAEHTSNFLLLPPLLRLMSGNGGRGGQANSGLAATRHSRKVHVHEHEHKESSQSSNTLNQNAFSGAAGKASGGSAGGPPALIDAISGNGGDGGDASSGPSLSGLWPQGLEVANVLGGS